MFRYFLDTRPYLMYVAIQASLIYLFVLLYLFFDFSIYFSLLFFVSTIMTIIYSKIKFQNNFLYIKDEIEKNRLNEIKNTFKTKFAGEKDVNLIFEKIDFASNLVKTRFKGTIFEERLTSLIEDSLSSFMKNLEIIDEMKKAQNLASSDEDLFKSIANKVIQSVYLSSSVKTKEDYSSQIDDLYKQNAIILTNIDILIKEMLIERKEITELNSTEERFKESFDLYQKIRGEK